jgi:hypothetical protein
LKSEKNVPHPHTQIFWLSLAGTVVQEEVVQEEFFDGFAKYQ